jgi:membrane fusion protein
MLFRKEAVEATRQRLYGQVLIATPITFWVVTAFLIGIIVVLVVFLATASFARIETVPGVVVPTGGTIQVRTPQAGILAGFTINEGDRVERGQIVGRIVTPVAATGTGTRFAAQLSGLESRVENITQRIIQSEAVATYEVALQDRKALEFNAQITQSRLLVALQRAQIAEFEASVARVSDLFARKLANVETVSVQNMRLNSALQDVQRLEGEIAMLTLRLESIPAEKDQIHARAALDRIELEAERTTLMSEMAVLRGSEPFDIIAPASGFATAIVVADGHSITDSRPLFSILPADEKLQVELYLPSSSIGFVQEGQSVRLLLDAFPYQRFGTLEGVVSELTSSVILPGGSENLVRSDQPVYRVTVALLTDTIWAYGRNQSLQPGMLLKANIVLEDRTILTWLLEPLMSVARRT